MQTKFLRKLHFGFLFFCCFSALLFLTCTVHAQIQQPKKSFSTSNLTYKIIDAPNNTYGYDIYSDNKRIIHQPSIPALAGNESFETKTAAAKVAQLVITKIKKGESLPTVTIEEMKKLQAIK